jgi:phosphate transport system substrate-binding protein
LCALASALAACAAALAGCGGSSSSAGAGTSASSSTIVWGAGGPVEFPIYEEAGSFLARDGITLNYQQLAPGVAMSGFRRGRLAFLAGDGGGAPTNLPRRGMTGAEYLPVARWPVSVIYNLPAIHVRLKLDGKVLADIYRGVIRTWNNPEIAHENPGVALPAIGIFVVHRSDPATATALFTRYLAAGSKRWRATIGAGRTVQWPGGTAEPGNGIVEGTVSQNRGAIGYTEQTVPDQSGFRPAALKDAAGAFVAPTPRTATSGKYPLVATAFIETYRDPCDAGLLPGQAGAAQRFFDYLLGPGQAMIARLGFAPLSRGARAHALAAVGRLQCGSQPIT